jgi:hypothetical protein
MFMQRRDVVAVLGTLLVAGVARLRWALAATEPQTPASSIAAVADTLFPGGEGLPSASALKLHERVLAMADLRASVAKGVAWLDRHAASRGGTNFAALDEPDRVAALDAAFASADDGIRAFVLALRAQIGLDYYSDPVIKKAFAYTGPPQPEGFVDFQERPS